MCEDRATILIADDNALGRRALVEQFESMPEFAVIGEASNGNEALDLTRALQPDLLILDDVLPYLDGLGVLAELKPEERPLVLLLISCASDSMIQLYYYSGATYCLLRPASPELVAERARLVLGQRRRVPGICPSRTEQSRIIGDLLKQTGIPAHLCGYRYLKDAVQFLLNRGRDSCTMTKEVYPTIARMHGTVPSRVERSIRHAIEVAWNRADLIDLHRLFGSTIHQGRGKPTNTEFVAMIADYVRGIPTEPLSSRQKGGTGH